MPVSNSSYHIILKDTKKHYYFAISKNTNRLSKTNANKIISSGMIWESCIVFDNNRT